MGTARDMLVLSYWTGLAAVIGNGRAQRARTDKNDCLEHGLVAQSENPVFWDWVFWQSFTDTQDPGGNGEGGNSEKGSREGRGKLAAEKNKITVA